MTKRELQQKIKIIVAQIVDKYRPEKIVLFGSAAWGSFSSDSDVDMLIIKSAVPSRGIDRQLEIDEMIERHGIALDMIVYKPEEIKKGIRLGDPFLKKIMKKGKVLHG